MNPIIEVKMPPWLYAKTHKVLGLTGLIVYKSAAVRQTDTVYEEVQQTLNYYDWTLIEESAIETKDMMFGLAELTLYALSAELAVSAVIIAEWLAEMLSETRRFLEV